MYHYITLRDIKIYMTGVGILLFIMTFIGTTYYYSRKYTLDFSSFSARLPWYLLFLYALGQYSWYLIEEQVWFPLHSEQLLLYLSPYDYSFHIVGIILGFIGIWRYMKTYYIREVKQQRLWLEVFFHAFTLASIPLGIFLLLGDNFIGASTDTSFYVSAIRSDSDMAVYGKVLPLGSFIAVWGLLLHLLHNFIHIYKKHDTQHIYLFYAIFSLGLCCILLFQQYPRHIVSTLGGITFDIKQYILLALSLGLLRQYRYASYTNKKTKMKINEATQAAQQQQQ